MEFDDLEEVFNNAEAMRAEWPHKLTGWEQDFIDDNIKAWKYYGPKYLLSRGREKHLEIIHAKLCASD